MKTYDTFAELTASTQLVTGTRFTVTEIANALYILQPSGYVALPGDATLFNNRVAALQTDAIVDARTFNVLGGGGAATVNLENAFSRGSDVILPSGVIDADSTVDVISKKINVYGQAGTILQRDAASGNCFEIETSAGASLTDLTIKLINKTENLTGHGATARDSDYSTIRNVTFEGILGASFGCFVFTDVEATPVYGATIENTKVIGSSSDISLSNGGSMLANCHFSLMSNNFTRGIQRFPIELKGNSKYCIISNSFIDDTTYGLYYGTQTSIHPSFSIANNTIIKDVDMGFYSGYGSYNITHNTLIDFGVNTGAKIGNNKTIGAKIINSESSIHTNILTVKDAGGAATFSVELTGTSKYNHISVAPRQAGGGVVQVGANAEKNSIEILGAKTFNSIFDAGVVDYDAAEHSGSEGNPIYNQSTGERWGTISGKFRDRIEDAAAVTLFSTDRFVYDAPTNGAGKSVITSSDSHNSGYVVATPTSRGEFLYRPGEGGWSLSTTGNQYRFLPTSVKPVINNNASLGESGSLWTELFASNATINTSDERLKTEFVDITETEKVVALEIKKSISKFKMLDSVSKKGKDGARIHFGVGAQTVRAIFEKHGLDAFDYSLFCYNEWEAEPEEKDESGQVTYAGRDAGNAYGIRYGQLSMFILSAM